MKIQVERFCRSLLSLPPFSLPPVDMISCIEGPWASQFARTFLFPIIMFVNAQVNSRFKAQLLQERLVSIEKYNKRIQKRPDYCVREPKLQEAKGNSEAARNDPKAGEDILEAVKADALWVGEVKLGHLGTFYAQRHCRHVRISKKILASMCLYQIRIAFLISPNVIEKIEYNSIEYM
ncbi:hypothetical protein CORT_0B09290 [Candida orthopsilosis Co 90-125]|uniref:Uncharacterized protein n=1 Tax=Candida orthopsilosis (strain 90-125) TaxID=1136231 RepID=H8X0C1_CANO9|nr:hypothetical protein CORT_0B09290 [Candida orthopsilosis Co 90-125]CCG22633.1 hypothetical protein CORT_0B09290 [Candida orthopsilosis Co 90-125]